MLVTFPKVLVDLILNISIIKTVSSLETYYVMFLLTEECLWRHLNKSKKIKYRELLFSIYFATKRSLNFLLKNNMLHSLPQRQCTMIDLCWERHHEREPLAIVQSFISLPDTPTPTPSHTLRKYTQQYPHANLPTFCITTQRHCWLRSF